jgi:hypothetical protein
MPELTRRRYPEAREECWHIYYGDVHAGTIAIRTGIPHDEDPWGWACGFYPGSHPGGQEVGCVPTFEEARAVARCARSDRKEICHVGARREPAIADTDFDDGMPLQGKVR